MADDQGGPPCHRRGAGEAARGGSCGRGARPHGDDRQPHGKLRRSRAASPRGEAIVGLGWVELTMPPPAHLPASSPQARTEAGVAAFASDSSKAAALFWAYVADARAGRWPSGTSEVLNDAALGPLPETPGSAHYPTGFEAWLRWREAVRRRKARSLARWRRAKNAERGAALAAGASAVPLAVAERVVVGGCNLESRRVGSARTTRVASSTCRACQPRPDRSRRERRHHQGRTPQP